LRIIARGILQAPSSSALNAPAEALRRLLPRNQRELLRVSSLPEQAPLEQSAREEKSEDEKHEELLKKIREAFERLYQQKLLASAESASNPAELAAILARLHGPEMTALLAEAKRAISAVETLAAEGGPKSPQPRALEGLRAARDVLERQTFLDSVAPLLQSIGERTLSLVPLAGENSLGRAEYMVTESAGPGRPPEVHLYLPLERLGAVRVRIFADDHERFAVISAARKDTADFLKERIPMFIALLQAAGHALQAAVEHAPESGARPISVEWERRFVSLNSKA
jgi:hypothetical protein